MAEDERGREIPGDVPRGLCHRSSRRRPRAGAGGGGGLGSHVPPQKQVRTILSIRFGLGLRKPVQE